MVTGKEKTISLNKTQLSTLLRISDPFLMIDKVTNIVPSLSGCGFKHINKDEWFYKCHFTDEPIMPGTLQIESMLQTIVAIIYSDTQLTNKNCLVTKSSANFYLKISTSGDLTINAQITKNDRGIVQAKADIYFDNKKTSDGIFKFINPDQLRIK
jgi:3-hydroxyacyl-[acyl-carrier-protein] dehydratase